jgi:hypothetical protein
MRSEDAEQTTATIVGAAGHVVTPIAFVVGIYLFSPPDAGLESLLYGTWSMIVAELALLAGLGIAAWVLWQRGRSDLAGRLMLGWGAGIAVALVATCLLRFVA